MVDTMPWLLCAALDLPIVFDGVENTLVDYHATPNYFVQCCDPYYWYCSCVNIVWIWILALNNIPIFCALFVSRYLICCSYFDS